MKEGAILANAARAALIDKPAFLGALRSGLRQLSVAGFRSCHSCPLIEFRPCSWPLAPSPEFAAATSPLPPRPAAIVRRRPYRSRWVGGNGARAPRGIAKGASVTSVHHLELDVLDDPSVLLRVVSVCHQRRFRIASLHYNRCTDGARLLLDVETGLTQLQGLEQWLARLVHVLAVRVLVGAEQRVDGEQIRSGAGSACVTVSPRSGGAGSGRHRTGTAGHRR
jgi:acetolactate synthase regulatory subunit